MAKPVLSAPHFHNEEAAFAFVESHLWPTGPTCPHCGNAERKAHRALVWQKQPSGPSEVLRLPENLYRADRLDLRGQPFPAASLAPGDPAH